MSVRTKIFAGLALLLFASFLLGMSGPGQRYLMGHPSPDHWIQDEQAMGAALAPVVYCLAPAVALAATALISFVFDKKRSS